MSDSLALLLKIFVGTLALNLLISGFQVRESRGGVVQKTTFYLWSVIFAQFLTAGIFRELNFLTVAIYSLNFFQSLMLCRFSRLTMNLDCDRRLATWIWAGAWLVTGCFAFFDARFLWLSMPMTLAIVFPMFSIVLKSVSQGRWRTFSSTQKLYVINTFLLAVHFLDYPVLRPDASLSMVGASLLYAFVHVYSILIPMMSNETTFNQYNARLEAEVSEKTKLLLNSNKMAALGEMAGGIAHEINTPLAVIKLNSELAAELLIEEPLDKALVEQKLSVVSRMIERIGKIIVGLRAFARDASSEQVVAVPLRALVESTLDLCRERFKQSGVELIVGPIPESFVAQGRPTELSQILLNLLNNSYDAIADKSPSWVKVEVARERGSYLLSVTDCGPGIPPAEREKLFQPFFTTKAVGKGTGLGLSISRGLAEAFGGQLFLDDKSEFTKFVLVLPA